MAAIDTLDIKEEFTQKDGETLQDLARQAARPGVIFVEIGSWKGYSTSFLAEIVKQCNGHLYCVDHWKGSPGVDVHKETKDCLEIFRHNMEVLGFSEYVHPLVMESSLAAKIFADGVADLVFIDADHYYKNVKADIQAWFKKVRIGGILCGHDAETFYSSLFDRDAVDYFLDSEYIGVWREDGSHRRGGELHPGVIRALYDCFNDKHAIAQGTRIWMIEREA